MILTGYSIKYFGEKPEKGIFEVQILFCFRVFLLMALMYSMENVARSVSVANQTKLRKQFVVQLSKYMFVQALGHPGIIHHGGDFQVSSTGLGWLSCRRFASTFRSFLESKCKRTAMNPFLFDLIFNCIKHLKHLKSMYSC